MDIVRYGAVRQAAAILQQSGFSAAQLRSLAEHPYAKDHEAAALLLMREDQVVGRYGLIPGRVLIAGEEHRMSWGFDWNVDTSVRGTAAAGLLLWRAMREVETLGGCGLSRSASPIYRAAGFERLLMPRQVVMLRSEGFWRRRIRVGPIAKLIALPVDSGMHVFRRAMRARAVAPSLGLELEAVNRFDVRVDEIDAGSGNQSRFPRDHRELNWVMDRSWLADRAFVRYGAFYVRRVGGIASGYALTRIRESDGVRTGTLLRSGLTAGSTEDGTAFLLLLTEEMMRQGAHVVEVCTTDRSMQRAASSLGMSSRGEVELVCRFAPASKAALAAASESLQDFRADFGEGDVLFL